MGKTFAQQATDTLIASVVGLLCVSCVMFGLRQLDPSRIIASDAKKKKKELGRRLGRPIKLNAYEDVIACDVVDSNDINVDFSCVGGLDDVKSALKELVVLPLKRPDLFMSGKLLRPLKGVLLYGPPGTGKTMLAKAIAKESEACFINVRFSNLASKWFGDAQKLVAAVFSLAYKLQPAIIFMDEIDSFLGKRGVSSEHEATNLMKTEFMALWDGFNTDANAQVIVLAATNRPYDLDPAILRRLPRTFEVGMPDRSQRAAILEVLLEGENVEDGIDTHALADMTEGYSGSDLTEIAKQAAYLPLRDYLKEFDAVAEEAGSSSRPRAIAFDDLASVIATNKLSKQAAEDYRDEEAAGNADDGGAVFIDLLRSLSVQQNNSHNQKHNR
ncbi:AAA-type ATPase family protein [Klebsormidium nitens]|uniref:AAA-type ATPase family protein n=1 Tax=Klebsormidium nitens TaxID=105231 RepID=A0A0U9HJM5_KLENI|nr:AAA-type ATPase family protein [Klebsormidium nitens]|eukprot:GAQ82002.1 AAA-type ATPase family protein [Klebsormidium nitens]